MEENEETAVEVKKDTRLVHIRNVLIVVVLISWVAIITLFIIGSFTHAPNEAPVPHTSHTSTVHHPKSSSTPEATNTPAPPVTIAPVETSAPVVAPVAPTVTYANCDAVKAAGKAPIHSGDPGWKSSFDRDGDGTGCDK